MVKAGRRTMHGKLDTQEVFLSTSDASFAASLRRRIRARRGSAGESSSDSPLLLLLEAGGARCALELSFVARIVPPVWSDMPRHPACPPAVCGVFGQAGLLYTVFDLGRLLGPQAEAPPYNNICGPAGTNEGVLLLLRSQFFSQGVNIALRADSAIDILKTPDVSGSTSCKQLTYQGCTIEIFDPSRLVSLLCGI